MGSKDRDGAQKVAVGFLIGAVTDVQLVHILSAAYLSLPTLPQNIISTLRSLRHKAVLKILSKVCAGYPSISQ